jgi:Na+/proline symporter
MTDYFRRHLGAKLLLSYLAIIIVGMVVLIIASQFILPTSFNRHMSGMNGEAGMGMGKGNQGFGNSASMRDFR